MSTFYSQYPASSGGSGSNPSVGPNGITAPTSSTEVAGVNPSGNLQPLQTDASGNLLVNINSETGAPFHVIVDSSALPTGAATAANQATQETTLSTIVANQTNGTQVTTITGTVPLPTGAATAANQVTEIGYISTVASAIGTNGVALPSNTMVVAGSDGTTTRDLSTDATGKLNVNSISGTISLPIGAATSINQTNGTQQSQIVQGGYTAIVTGAGALTVDGSAVTQPISASSLPLPLNAATSALQGVGNTSLSTIAGTINTTGGTTPSTATLVAGSDGTHIQALSTDVTGKLNINNISGTVSLPTGAAAAANQTNVQSAPGTSAATAVTIQGSASGVAIPISGTVTVTPSGEQNVNLNQVGGSAIAIGQQLSAASLPVVLPATQITALTPPTTVTVTQATGTNLHTVVDSSALPSGAATLAAQTTVQGPVTPGTVATNSLLQGVQYNTTLPTVTNGQQVAMQSDSQGRLLVVEQVLETAVGPKSAGVAAASSILTGAVYNTTNPTPTNGQQVSLQVDQFSNLETVAPDLIVTGQSAQTAVVNNILTTTSGTAATLVDNYKSASVQVVSTGTGGTFIFEGSNDNVNFQTIPVFNQAVVTGTAITVAITATASSLIYVFPLQMNYIRLRIATTITGGSIQAFSRFTQATWAPNVFPVAQATAANLNVTVGSGTITTVSTVTDSNTGFPGIIADISSAAITTTTTTAAFTPTYGSSYLIDIPVTVVTGTTPTYQVTVQESADSGTNWYNVYAFPTITTTGSYTSPVITMTGNRVRYVQTLTGTTPSFTRAINRLQSSQAGYNVPTGGILTDASGTTSATPNTSTQIMAANSFRKYLLIQNVSSNNMWINFTSAATTTQPSIQLLPGGSLVQESGFVSGEAVNVICAAATQAYTAKWA